MTGDNLGRWLSRDPQGGITAHKQFNLLYGFVENNSLNRWDYLGLEDINLSATNQTKIKNGNFLRHYVYWHGIYIGYVQMRKVFVDASLENAINEIVTEMDNIFKRKIGGIRKGDLKTPHYLGAGLIVDFVPSSSFKGNPISKHIGWRQTVDGKDDTSDNWDTRHSHPDFPGKVIDSTGDDSCFRNFQTSLAVCNEKNIVYTFTWAIGIYFWEKRKMAESTIKINMP